LTPKWDASDLGYHVFFGNAPLVGNPGEVLDAPLSVVTPDSMVCGVGPATAGNIMVFRVIDTDSNIHETRIANPTFWDGTKTIHLRAIWDSTNINIQSINSIIFSSATIGYACGPNGVIAKTTDAGLTWTQLASTGLTYDFYCVDFISDTEGYVCGEYGTILKTINGGVSWTLQTCPVIVDLKSIYFKDANTGFACGADGVLLTTSDGGTTWTSIASSEVQDFNSISMVGTKVIAASKSGKIYQSTDSGVTYTEITGLPRVKPWNAISRAHAAASTIYVVGNSGSILRYNGAVWTNLSVLGPDVIIPNLLCVSHASTAIVWIPWGKTKFAYSINSGVTFSFVDADIDGPFKAVANLAGTGKAIIAGVGGRLVDTLDFGVTQNIRTTGCSSLSLQIDGKEPTQTKIADCSFDWEPTNKTDIFFGDYRKTGRPLVGQPGDNSANTIMDEVVIYGVPTPGFSAFNRHEFNTAQTAPVSLVSSDMVKRIEWGSISPLIKTKTEWKEFKMFYCGAKVPVQTFGWDTRLGLIDDVILDIAEDQNGHLWLATNNGISRFDMNVASACIDAFLSGRDQPQLQEALFFNYSNLANGLIADTINSIAVDENGDIWAGTSKGLMLLSLSTTSTAEVEDPTLASGTTVATQAQFVAFTTGDGLPSNNITVVRAGKGSLFIGTDAGLAVIGITKVDRTTSTIQAITSLGTVSIYDINNGMPSNNVQAIAQENDGPVWVGTDRGLVQFNGKKVLVYGTYNGLVSRNIVSITVDSDSKKYIGTGFGLTVINGIDFTNYPPSTGVGTGAIRGGDEDGAGTMWFATANGLLEMDQLCDTIRFSIIGMSDGIIGDNRIIDYQRYRILGGSIPFGGCDKVLVTVSVNGKQLSIGFTVDPHVPWIVFDTPLGPSDVVETCVKYGWRKIRDFTFDKNNNEVSQAQVETEKNTYLLYRKRFQVGTVSLGGCFADGAQNTSTTQYAVFAVPITTGLIPISAISKPTTAAIISTTALDDSIYSDIDEKITGLPEEIVEAQRIALDSTEADNIDSDYLDFTLSADAIIYVAYDSRSLGLPSWLKEFSPVPVVIRISDMETFTDATNQEKLFVSTQGTNGCVYDILHDPTVCDISDQIAVDVTPPVGCATITKVNSRSSMTLQISADDAVTGVSDMQISPREDFTTDGTTPVPYIPYYPGTYIFNLPADSTATTGNVADTPDDTVPGGSTIPPPVGMTNNVFHTHLGVLLIGTKNPGRVYKFDQATKIITLLFETGEDEVDCMTSYGNDLIVGTGNNGKTFRWNGTTLSQLPIAAGNKVLAAGVFANQIYLGYWPTGQIYTVDQFGNMQLFKTTYETGITGFAVYGGSFYWTSMNETVTAGQTLATTTKRGHKHFVTVPSGITVLYNINATTSVADGHSHAVINGVIQIAQSHIHGLNGSASGKIFKYDAASGQAIIVHSEPDYAVTAITATSESTADGILFAGTSPHGKVLRFIPDEQLFIKSFQTPKMTVIRLRYYTKMYAMVDDTIYGFTGQHWEYVASVTDTAHDIAPEAESSTSTTAGGILVLRDEHVASTSAAPQALNPRICAYVRFRDGAGNVSSIRDDKGALVVCYSPCIDLTATPGTGTGTTGTDGTTTGGLVIGKNRLMEIDNDANVIMSLDGTEAFLSGNKVEEERAVYYSEIFNGTNSFVQWTILSWVAVLPTGTSVTMAFRNASTSSGISSATWSDEYSESQTYPIGSGIDITNLTGQFLQFRATLRATVKGVSGPILQKVDIGLRTSQAVHYFTTNFSLPDNLKQAFVTYNGCSVPPTTDIVFGVTGLDSTDFSDYFVLSPDKVIDLPAEQQTKNFRVGIKFISSPTDVPIVDEFAVLISLANDAMIRINQAGQPVTHGGQLVPSGTTRTVSTEVVQGHSHLVTFSSTILDKADINGDTSIASAHQHTIISGIVQVSAGHSHLLTI